MTDHPNQPPPGSGYGSQGPGQPGGPPPYAQPPAGYPPGGGEPPRRKTGLIVGLVVLAVLLLAGGIVAGVLLLGDDDGSSTSADPEASTESTLTESAADDFCTYFEENANSNEFDSLGANDTDKIQAELEKFRDVAPDELKDDYDILISAVEGDPDAAAGLQDAVTNIQTYAVDTCDVTLDEPTP